jgi:dihydroorotate dehydrogenase (fumarate)
MDLSTTYLGLRLSSPLVPSGSPLTREIASLRHMEEAGAGAVALHSLFQEQLEAPRGRLSPLLTAPGALAGERTEPAPPAPSDPPEALAYYPRYGTYGDGAESYAEYVASAKAALGIPVIASLNGVSAGEWLESARAIEQAGADALEINLYYVAADATRSGAEIEESHLRVVREVRQLVDIPLAVKLSPFYTSVAHMATRFVESGADGLVLFDRFYQPDIDQETLEVVPHPALSTLHAPEGSRLPMRWIALLFGRVDADLAASGGIHVAADAVKMLLAGATVTMLAAELMRGGIDRLRVLRDELTYWMREHEYDSLDELRGRVSQRGVAHPAAFERAAYIRIAAQPPLSTEYDGGEPTGTTFGPWAPWEPAPPPDSWGSNAHSRPAAVPDHLSAATARRPIARGRGSDR